MSMLPQLDEKEKDPQREGLLYSSIFRVAAQITEICAVHNKDPEQLVETYCKVYDMLVERWFKATPMKEDIRKLLEMFFPDYYAPYPDDSPYKKKW